MFEKTFDLIILGAGALGSASAYHAAKRGQRVLLLEQFEIDHGRGSSYGASRIIRYSYDHRTYIEMAKATYPMWATLEAECGERLYTKTGGIDFGVPGTEPMFDGMLRSMPAMAIPHEVLSAEEGMRRFPQFHLDEGMVMLYQEDAGVLAASRCVRALVNGAVARGAVVRENTRVAYIQPNGDGVIVSTPEERYYGARLIVTAGAWARPLMQSLGLDLPLQPVKCQENYFDAPDSAQFDAERFPTFIAHLPEYGYMPYGIPSVNGSGVKVALHGGANYDPETLDRTPDESIVDTVRHFTSRYLPAADAPLKGSRVCLYTMTPDEHFIIDTHPEFSQIVIGACCSGHAFKFSTLIGQILTELAVDGATGNDLSLFRLARFQTVTP